MSVDRLARVGLNTENLIGFEVCTEGLRGDLFRNFSCRK